MIVGATVAFSGGATMQQFTMRASLATSTALALFASFSAAKADTLPPIIVYSYAGVFDASGNVTDKLVTNPGPGIGAQAGAQNSQASSGSVISNITSPSVFAGVTTTANQYQAFADTELTYYFQLTSSVGDAYGINIIANGTYNVSGGQYPAYWSNVTLTVDQCYSANCPYPSGFSSPIIAESFSSAGNAGTGGPVSYSSNFNVNTGVIYRVDIFAGAQDYGLAASVSASLDPVFTVDDPNAQDYQLVFNDGISNGAAVATPLPAALPLFASGLSAMGLFCWRRKRKGAAIAV